MAGEEGSGTQTEVERLQAELEAARAEASRYRGAYEQGRAKAAEAERRAALDKAGELTEEEKAALDKFGEVDPSGRKALDALDAARRRREAALLDAGSGQPAASGGGDFDAEVTRLMGTASWRETLRSTEYAEWYERQAPELKAIARSEDPASAVRVLTLYESEKKGGGDVGGNGRGGEDDPRLAGAGNAPGGRGLRISQTRNLRAQADDEWDEEDYMAGWNYAGKEFEDNYRMLSPDRSGDRLARVRDRVGR